MKQARPRGGLVLTAPPGVQSGGAIVEAGTRLRGGPTCTCRVPLRARRRVRSARALRAAFTALGDPSMGGSARRSTTHRSRGGTRPSSRSCAPDTASQHSGARRSLRRGRESATRKAAAAPRRPPASSRPRPPQRYSSPQGGPGTRSRLQDRRRPRRRSRQCRATRHAVEGWLTGRSGPVPGRRLKSQRAGYHGSVDRADTVLRSCAFDDTPPSGEMGRCSTGHDLGIASPTGCSTSVTMTRPIASRRRSWSIGRTLKTWWPTCTPPRGPHSGTGGAPSGRSRRTSSASLRHECDRRNRQLTRLVHATSTEMKPASGNAIRIRG